VIDVRPVLYIDGFLLLVLAGAMGVPVLIDSLSGSADWQVFLAAAAATGFIAGVLILGNRPRGRFVLDIRQAYLVTVSGGVLVAAFAALPLAFSTLHLSITDAVFEAMSGLTTTGATIVTGLGHLPAGLLVWRALLNWLGGAAIIVMGMAVLPFLRIGGMQLFRMDSSDRTEKIHSRLSQVVRAAALTYALLTLGSALAFSVAGMGPLDAVCQAMAAVSTGGFSTSDRSLAHWGAAVQWVAVASMIVGAAPLPLLVAHWRRNPLSLIRDPQLRTYLGALALLSLAMGVWRWSTSNWDLGLSLRYAAFSVTSVVTTTGFVVTDYGHWGGFARVVFFLLTFVGGCTGSPAGAIRIFRWQVLLRLSKVHVKRLLHPHGVFSVEYRDQAVPDAVVRSVLAFVIVYMVTFAVHAVALALTGLDLSTALSASAAALGNGGRGLGEIVGPAGSYRLLPDAAKWILTFEMLVGRLELFTVFVVFSRGFWRE
jgi:trk system potassium uptake protein TrkH